MGKHSFKCRRVRENSISNLEFDYITDLIFYVWKLERYFKDNIPALQKIYDSKMKLFDKIERHFATPNEIYRELQENLTNEEKKRFREYNKAIKSYFLYRQLDFN